MWNTPFNYLVPLRFKQMGKNLVQGILKVGLQTELDLTDVVTDNDSSLSLYG